jgi:hypothetical protein
MLKCPLCVGEYPPDKHDFVICASVDIEWDLEQMKISNDLTLKKSKKVKIKNKGTGAGGSNTTLNGLSFEDKTSSEILLIKNGYDKKRLTKDSVNGWFIEYKSLTDKNTRIVFTTQSGLNAYCKKHLGIDHIYKNPDEVFLIFNDSLKTLNIKVIEKKSQNSSGSVDEKIPGGVAIKQLYKKMFQGNVINEEWKIYIHYAFTLNTFLLDLISQDTKKYKDIRELLSENDIKIFHGDDDNYLTELFKYILKNDEI